jgi:GDP-mannose 6-dehydrogenase
MRVSVFGLGYVGCVTAACLAKAGHQVIGVDINPDKVAMLRAGRSPIVEPGLGELLADVVGGGRLTATMSSFEAVAQSDLALICVGTPGRANGQLDVAAVVAVAREIGAALQARPTPFTVVLRSTVLPGTTERVLLPTLRDTAGPFGLGLHVAVNPEFMREGCSLRDFATPPFTVVGCDDPEPVPLLRSLYAEVQAPFVCTGLRAAETVKYVANAFHALKVCFANEVGDLCETFGIDPNEVMRIFLMDRKLNVSEAYLRPGFAFGGSCLPKDLRALLYAARGADVAGPLLSAILPSNEAQVRRGIEAVLGTRKRRVGVVGLAFKQGTDDLRESPLVAVVEALIGKGCDVRILDRSVSIAQLVGANRRYIEEEIPHIASLMCDDVDEFLAHADVIVIGNADEASARVLGKVAARHVVVDLTRRAGAAGASGEPIPNGPARA